MKITSEKEFIQIYDNLKSAKKVAEYFKCSKTTVLNYAKKIGYDNSKNKEIKLPKSEIQNIINLYENFGTEYVAKQYSCSTTAVLNFLKSNNYKPQNKNSKLSFVNKEDFIKDYEELKSAAKMGEKYNCSGTAILNYAKKINYNVNNNKNYKLSKEDKEEIIKLYNKKSSNELAQQYNVSRGMITKIWFDANLIGKTINNINTVEKDISGKEFGYWTVLYKTDKRNASGIIYWHCKCRCGIERDVLGSSLRNGLSISCGNHSNISKGNNKIKEILFKENIPFEMEKKFKTCKDKKELPFDFYVNDKYLIEYDGEQHYDKESIFDYEYTHNHDLIKSQWCKENNIPLIRIPYWHYEDLCLEDLLLETSVFID